MKRNIVTFILTAILVIVVFMTFGQAESAVGGGAVRDLPKFNHAKVDSAGDFKKFKKEAELEIAKNRKAISELKDRKSKGAKSAKAGYRDQIMKVEESNDHMAIKINTSEMIQTKNWTSFKRDFTREMTELRTSIQDIAEGKPNP
jgi:hypothetical protein